MCPTMESLAMVWPPIVCLAMVCPAMVRAYMKCPIENGCPIDNGVSNHGMRGLIPHSGGRMLGWVVDSDHLGDIVMSVGVIWMLVHLKLTLLVMKTLILS